MITRDQLSRAMTYEQYGNLLRDLLSKGRTTGPNQSEAYLSYAKINLQRMARLDKTVNIDPGLKSALNNINNHYTWLVLTEGWCSDAAQNLPIISAIEKLCPRISLRLLLRDENPELMDQYLTGTSRAIPKLICVEDDTLRELFTWGPRPAAAQTLMLDLKSKNTPSAERSLEIQKWYNADKTSTIQSEFLELIQTKLK